MSLRPPFQLIVVAGPTAVGKSALAFEIARQNQGELLCADSRQIYKDLDIGTAKPSAEEQQAVPHHLFDIADPRETFTLVQYLEAAEAALADIWKRGKLPVIVGGTGLYLKSLLYAYQIPEVAPQTELRQELLAQESDKGTGYLHQYLSSVDPITAARLHPHDLRRIVRALEVLEVTGQPISAQQGREPELRYACLYLGLNMPRPQLETRIMQRIAEMIQIGLIDEVKALRERYGSELPLLQTLNYREVGDYLDGKMDLATTMNAMHIHTRQYAKRQMTWFRKDPGIHWLDLNASGNQAHYPWLQSQGLQLQAPSPAPALAIGSP